ncbi:MAG: hypothetical protein ABIU58_05860 [Ramlibacter sp.]
MLRVVQGDRPFHLQRCDPNARVTAIRACGDGYRVTTADGQTEVFWEFNLRFKTDGSSSGPAPRRPMLIGGGMQEDRAFVVFSRFEEIAEMVRRQCAAAPDDATGTRRRCDSNLSGALRGVPRRSA